MSGTMTAAGNLAFLGLEVTRKRRRRPRPVVSARRHEVRSASWTDDRVVVAAALDLLDRDPEAARAIVGSVPDNAVAGPDGTVLAAIRRVVATVDHPTVHDVRAALRDDRGSDDESQAWATFVDAVADMHATGLQAARLGREAADRIAERYRRMIVSDAAVRVADEGATPAAVADLVRVVADNAVARRGSPTALDALDRWACHERTPAVVTGFPWFDEPTEGGLPVGLTVLAAPPERGKSALALQLTVGALLADHDLRAVWAAGEMTLSGIGRRLVVVASGLVEGAEPVTMGAAGRGAPRARVAATHVAKAIGDRLTFVEAPLTVSAIDAAVAKAGVRLLVVDYLQLVTVPDGGRDRVADLDRLVGQLRELAIRRELAIVLVSSVANRSAASDHAGQIGRGSAEIGYAAELVYAGEREEHPDGRPAVGPDGTVAVTWRCKKARNAEPRDLVLRFDGSRQAFVGHPAAVENAQRPAAAAWLARAR